MTTYLKIVNGEEMPMTPDEIAQCQIDAAKAARGGFNTLVEAMASHLQVYGSTFEKGPFTFEDFTEDGTEEHRRNAKETIDFLRELGEDAPAQIPWNSPNHGIQIITLDDLGGWLLGVGTRRFKRFAIQTALGPNLPNFTTKEQVESAFNAAYSNS